VNKQALIQKIVEKLTADLALYFKAATIARAEATHEQSKPENKYDTRGLEASYLARGQSRQAAEIEMSIHTIAAMEPKNFIAGAPVDLGAYVEIEVRRETSRYFIASRAGGTEVVFDGNEVLVITPQSPLGRQLIGHRQGETVKIEVGGRTASQRIVTVA
jgi:transcription elongation GreA/GreB family factor